MTHDVYDPNHAVFLEYPMLASTVCPVVNQSIFKTLMMKISTDYMHDSKASNFKAQDSFST